MANNMTTYLQTALLKHAVRAGAATAFTQPAAVYLSLHTASPGYTGSLAAEVSGGSYARQAITFGASTANGNAQETKNSLITFPTASAAWGTVTDIGINDASTAGNMLFFGALAASKVVGSGDTFTMPANNLTLDLD